MDADYMDAVIEQIGEAERTLLLSRAVAGARLDGRIAELHALGLGRRAISEVLRFYHGATVSPGRVRGSLIRQGLAR